MVGASGMSMIIAPGKHTLFSASGRSRASAYWPLDLFSQLYSTELDHHYMKLAGRWPLHFAVGRYMITTILSHHYLQLISTWLLHSGTWSLLAIITCSWQVHNRVGHHFMYSSHHVSWDLYLLYCNCILHRNCSTLRFSWYEWLAFVLMLMIFHHPKTKPFCMASFLVRKKRHLPPHKRLFFFLLEASPSKKILP